MPLQPGTALQNGHYVIDALLEAAPTGALYWGTHVVTGTQVYIQVFELLEGLPTENLSDLIARLEGLSFSPESLLPRPLQIFHEEGRILCLVLGATVGLPWSQQCHHHRPLSPSQALPTIRRIAAGLTWLTEKDLVVKSLSPAQVWFASEGDRITLTGLPQGYLPAASSTLIQSLAYLLWSFLTGKLPPTATLPETSVDSLQQQAPQIHPTLLKALSIGMSSQVGKDTSLDMAQWLTMLSDDSLTTSVPSMTAPLATASPQSPPTRKRFFSVYPTLGMTALMAAIAGVTLGTVWRLNAASLPGNIQFDPSQSFPSQTGWSGDTPEAASFVRPVQPERPVYREEPRNDTDWTIPSPSPTSQEADWTESDSDIWQREESEAIAPLEDYPEADRAPGSPLAPEVDLANPEGLPSSKPLAEEPAEEPASDLPLPLENETPEFFLKKPTHSAPDEDVLSNAAEPDTSVPLAMPNDEVEPLNPSDS
ncbi:MAG: hypothetical protein AAGH78_07870 [Cyanobacteria bacterium P01_H01_bin.58]